MDPFLPAWRLAELTRSRQIGCLELLDLHISRVAGLDTRINAVILRDADRARTRARALDDAGTDDAGPLHGVPMTVKESFDLAGHPTTWGHAIRQSHRAAQDATAVQRIEAAGAVVFGKSNVPVSLADWQSYNPVYGATANPWDTNRTPGGSSGGGAAAVAAGFSALEIGSDIGGSIRVPAHFCGVFGHKSSWGLCSMRGHSIAEGRAPPDISVIGPMARSARDLAPALTALTGPNPAETEQIFSLPPARATRPADLRVAVWTHEPGQITSAETVAAVEQAGHALAAAGARVDFAARPELAPLDAYRLYLALLDAALSARMPDDVLAARRAAKAALAPDDMSTDAIMTRAVDMPHREFLALQGARLQMRLAWGRFFRDFDVLICPAFGVPAFEHQQLGQSWERHLRVDGQDCRYNDLLFWPGLTGAFHLPATVAPVTMSADGLPIGVQIAGPHFGDLTTIAAAEMMEAFRPFVPPPGWG